jgi:hypothetical protein
MREWLWASLVFLPRVAMAFIDRYYNKIMTLQLMDLRTVTDVHTSPILSDTKSSKLTSCLPDWPRHLMATCSITDDLPTSILYILIQMAEINAVN